MKELDFTMLDNITAEKPNRSLINGAALYNAPEGREKVHLQRTQEVLQRATEIYNRWSGILNKSEKQRKDILKSAALGVPSEELLLKAIECIYTITEDKGFYNTILERLNKKE